MVRVDRKVIARLYLERNCPIDKMRLVDNFYSLPSAAFVRDRMENFRVRPYIPEINDCDNQALSLLHHFSGLGIAFAWVSSGPHDFCSFVDEKYRVWDVEPSTCNIFKPSDDLTWLVMP